MGGCSAGGIDQRLNFFELANPEFPGFLDSCGEFSLRFTRGIHVGVNALYQQVERLVVLLQCIDGEWREVVVAPDQFFESRFCAQAYYLDGVVIWVLAEDPGCWQEDGFRIKSGMTGVGGFRIKACAGPDPASGMTLLGFRIKACAKPEPVSGMTGAVIGFS